MMMFYKYSFCILAFLFLTFVGAAPTPSPDPQTGLVGVQYFASRSLYFALSAKASVYECTVANTGLLPRENNGCIKGAVTLSIERTLVGKDLKQLKLPCGFLDMEHGPYFIDDNEPIWPDLTQIQHDHHLCVVVVPKTYDRTVPLIHGVDQAASHVFVADKSSDGGFKWLYRILDLQSALIGKDRTTALLAIAKARTDPDVRVRDYAIDAFADQCAESHGQDHLFDALREGDSIILATIDKIVPNADVSLSISKGDVVLNVRSWLQGSGKRQLRFAYEYEKQGVMLKARLLDVWPRIEELKKDDLLVCVFKHVATDKRTDSFGDVDGAAAILWPVSDENDPAVAAIKEVISLDSDKNATDWSQKLSKGLKSPESLVRQYSVDAVMHDVGRTSKNDATSLLTEHLSQFTDINPGPIETLSTIQHLETLTNPEDPGNTAKAIHGFALAIATEKNQEWVRRYALQGLALILRRSRAPNAETVLNKDEVSALRIGLEHATKPENEWNTEKVQVVKWLPE